MFSYLTFVSNIHIFVSVHWYLQHTRTEPNSVQQIYFISLYKKERQIHSLILSLMTAIRVYLILVFGRFFPIF